MTLQESAAGAVFPWNSIDAQSEIYDALPQQDIEVCLSCRFCAEHCDNCSDWNVRKQGRPKKEIDAEMLRELMRLKRCNADMCAALGVSERTLLRAKKELKNGGKT